MDTFPRTDSLLGNSPLRLGEFPSGLSNNKTTKIEVFIYLHTCIHACIHTYIHTYIHVYMYVCMYVCTCLHVCMYVCMYVCMCSVGPIAQLRLGYPIGRHHGELATRIVVEVLMFRNDINVHDYNRQLQNSDVKEFNLGYSRERRLMSSWRLHMSDVENEKSEGLVYTIVFKGKHTFQKTYTLNLPGGLEFGLRAVSGSVYRGPKGLPTY